ncbi:diacylglycerol kinase family protein [Luteococcus sp. H138]|uniref:diacylglycerol/lipid kinase family protein n=1 Tax=unclassified Luteococcus TaxID=2639923 RepID=UPI00313EA855
MVSGPIIHLVVNPSAGRGRARRLLPRVHNTLADAVPDGRVVVHLTTSYDDARRQALESARSARPGRSGNERDSLVVMGGDGMAHLGLNACAEARADALDVPLGIIPAGTGNDFCRGVGLPADIREATLAVAGRRTRRIDLTEVAGPLTGGDEHRYVGSVVSTGYDARVNLATNDFRYPIGPLGPLAYGALALGELARFRPLDYRIEIDGQRRELSSVLVAVANAGHFGGGMHIVPDADVTDGLLDVLIVGDLKRRQVLALLPKLYTGGHVGHPAVEFVQARQVRIDGQIVNRDGSRAPMFAMADGERLGGVPLTATCRPGLIDVFTA